MRFDWKAAASGVLAGLLAGGALGFWAARRGPAGRDHARLVERFGTRLKLTPVQRSGLETILERQRTEMHALREQMHPRFDGIRRASRAEIRALLTPEQLPEFEKMTKEWDAELERRRLRREAPR